jgi:hypothetical protein
MAGITHKTPKVLNVSFMLSLFFFFQVEGQKISFSLSLSPSHMSHSAGKLICAFFSKTFQGEFVVYRNKCKNFLLFIEKPSIELCVDFPISMPPLVIHKLAQLFLSHKFQL